MASASIFTMSLRMLRLHAHVHFHPLVPCSGMVHRSGAGTSDRTCTTSSVSFLSPPPSSHLNYQQQRAFSIMNQYEKGAERLKRLPQRDDKEATTTKGEEHDSSVDSSPSQQQLGGGGGGGGEETALVDSTTSTSSSSSTTTAIAHNKNELSAPRNMAQQVIKDLETQNAIHEATMQAVERSPEWQDYDAHINFELNMLRARYASTPNEPLTQTRKTQMAAHLRAVQQEVMESHAQAAADKLIASLTPREVDELRVKLRRIDADVKDIDDGSGSGSDGGGGKGSIFDKDFQDALWELSSVLSAAQNAGVLKGAKGPPEGIGRPKKL